MFIEISKFLALAIQQNDIPSKLYNKPSKLNINNSLKYLNMPFCGNFFITACATY